LLAVADGLFALGVVERIIDQIAERRFIKPGSGQNFSGCCEVFGATVVAGTGKRQQSWWQSEPGFDHCGCLQRFD